ncbi:FAD binding domain-containing protein [Aspergillus sergii]|uniref:FAD binding domain-containing protein n=1 Tax=Aspergillus sergii TaxID=1034303 RepID=A0A5N6XDX3_9EURO|nr:FAD binding domain-containing protein [Aspergillus sergii]
MRESPFCWVPLPRLSPEIAKREGEYKHEIIIVGAGPAGLMLKFLLSHYGLNDESVLCIDDKPKRLDRGHADGLQPRTMEVLKSLGLADRILHTGRHLWEFAFWEHTREKSIKRSFIAPTMTEGARYKQVTTINQGLVEREFEDGLLHYGGKGVQRNSKLVDVQFDGDEDPEFPITAQVDVNGTTRRYRTKFLVAADGAHSTVRRCMGVHMRGESRDDVWGVIDLVADTDFPDIQRRCFIQSEAGSIFVVPREQIYSGTYLTRLYVELKHPTKNGLCRDRYLHNMRRDDVSKDIIMRRVVEAFQPYYFRPKGDGAIHWWSSYQIGQRMLDRFIIEDSLGMGRIFFVGDACHTHSPKAGQGMNVSMMDSYNLSWKLAYSVLGLTPQATSLPNSNPILETYHTERFSVAQELIHFDRKYSTMFSRERDITSRCNSHRNVALSKFIETHRDSNEFTSGCGVEYPESVLTMKLFHRPHEDPSLGVGALKAGKRLPDLRLKRYADGSHCNLQDDLPSNGCFRVLCFTSTDLLDSTGKSAQALCHLSSTTLPRFPSSTIEQLVIYPAPLDAFEWEHIPHGIRYWSEMRFYNGYEVNDAYAIYGLDPAKGALAIVRPDGYIGVVGMLTDLDRIDHYLGGCIATIR